MTKILFVDDEPNILDGLRRMLRDMRHKWQMSFASGGAEALKLLATERFDIIVSDMRMPVIDGAMLLGQVRKLYPHMTRIILSGHSEQKAIMKSVRLAHQYLAKPCDPETLKKALAQSEAMRRVLGDENLSGLVAQIESLPSLGHTYTQLLDALDSEDASVDSIGLMVSQDMGLAATVLKLVNSAFFGLPQQVSSPSQAVGLLGLEVIKGLVLSQGFFTSFDSQCVPGINFRELWLHCLMVGGHSRCILELERAGKAMADKAFIAGIMHDVGKLVLAAVLPEAYAEVVETVRTRQLPLWEVETQMLGATHGQAGAYLLGLWGAAEEVVGAIAYHERPAYGAAMGGSRGRLLLAAVHTANFFEHEMRLRDQQLPMPKLDRGFLAEVNLMPNLERWRSSCLSGPMEGASH